MGLKRVRLFLWCKGVLVVGEEIIEGGGRKVLFDDGRTLWECGVEEGSVVFMVQRCVCCGGGNN